MAWRRATVATEAPGSSVSSTIRRFSSTAQDRRLGRAVFHDQTSPMTVETPIVSTIR